MKRNKEYTKKDMFLSGVLAFSLTIIFFMVCAFGYLGFLKDITYSTEIIMLFGIILFPILIFISWYMFAERYIYLLLKNKAELDKKIIYCLFVVAFVSGGMVLKSMLNAIKLINTPWDYIEKPFILIMISVVTCVAWLVCLACTGYQFSKLKDGRIINAKSLLWISLVMGVLLIGSYIGQHYTEEQVEHAEFIKLLNEQNL